jgi:hypothetical protein
MIELLNNIKIRITLSDRDANETVPGFEPEPKTRFFGKFSNPEPVPEPESDFLRTHYLNPNPSLKFLKLFCLNFCRKFQFLILISRKNCLNLLNI